LIEITSILILALSLKMKQYNLGGLLLLVLAFGTFESVFGGGSTCTPATCVGPVVLSFSNSNCTGDIVYQEVNVDYFVCSEGRYYNTKDENGISFFSFYSAGTCDREAANASFSMTFNKWGACQFNNPAKRGQFAAQFSASSQSYLYLLNVNDSYASPQDFDNQPLPAWSEDETPCYSPDNCTLANGQTALAWNTYYPSIGTCEDPTTSYMNSKVKFNECMNLYNFSYVKAGCFDEKGSYTAFYKDAACTKLSEVYAYRSSCLGYYYNNHCNGPITPIPTRDGPGSEPSPSNASLFQLSSILVVIALVAFSAAL
jgi:hypothetical protein